MGASPIRTILALWCVAGSATALAQEPTTAPEPAEPAPREAEAVETAEAPTVEASEAIDTDTPAVEEPIEANFAPPPAPTPLPAAAPAPAPISDAELAPELTGSGVHSQDAAHRPTIDLRVFSDVGYRYDDDARSKPGFRLGEVELLVTGELSPEVRAVSETVLAVKPALDSAEVDIERLYLEWELAPQLSLRAGRDQLSIGRYMRVHDHALVRQLATARPRIVAFEDEVGPAYERPDGRLVHEPRPGYVPTHQTGVQALGDLAIDGETELHYTLSVGNGRGRRIGELLSSQDLNDWPALGLQLSLLPGMVEGLEAGFSGYFDRIPAGLRGPDGEPLIFRSIDEWIAAFHLAYIKRPVDIQAELFYLYHVETGAGADAALVGGFVQIGYSAGDFTPYLRVELLDRDRNDIFYNNGKPEPADPDSAMGPDLPEQLVELRLGLRYDLAESAALKLEAPLDFDREVYGIVGQVAFGI